MPAAKDQPPAVRLRPDASRREPATDLEALAADCSGPNARQVSSALALAAEWGGRLPLPGSGSTAGLWEALATVAAIDLQIARVLEPHLDARAILAQAGRGDPPAGSTWGVYAAEGPGTRLQATAERPEDGTAGSWTLTGRKPWCSLADRVDHALVTAWVDETRRGLFEVELSHPGVAVLDELWVARGLPEVRSNGVAFDDVPAIAVGGPGWYLERDGFAWGGIAVAAVWYGGAVGVARRMQRQVDVRDPDQIALMHLGAVDAFLTSARAVLGEAAEAVDRGTAAGRAGHTLALRVRQVVVTAVEETLRHAAHALGPGPLAGEEEYAARVADLELYVRQHHAERDAAALGAAGGPGRPW